MANALFPTASSQKVQEIFGGVDDTAVADEGGYYIATNPTVGTGIAMTTSVVDDAATASSTHAQFAPAMLMYNPQNANNPNAVSYYLRYLKLFGTTFTSATDFQYSIRLDNSNRYSSGGSLITPVNPNTGSSRSTSTAILYFGAIVPTALPSANARLVARGYIAVKSAPAVVAESQYLFKFGNSGMMDSAGGATTVQNQTINAPPIILAPGWMMQLDLWGTALAAAPAFEFEFGWVERVAGQ